MNDEPVHFCAHSHAQLHTLDPLMMIIILIIIQNWLHFIALIKFFQY